MVIKERKFQKENSNGDTNYDVKKDEQKEKSWSITKLFKDGLKGLLLILIVPAFLNYAALVKEEKELKPKGFILNFHLVISFNLFYILLNLLNNII